VRTNAGLVRTAHPTIRARWQLLEVPFIAFPIIAPKKNAFGQHKKIPDITAVDNTRYLPAQLVSA
jgi:hypothetical protein